MPEKLDCIVAGGGHAGCEAAAALSRLGFSTLLISGNLDRLGYLSCNPAIGGLAKGHMVREIDALGGQMGRWADSAAIQFRTLNMSKGPAVRATRAQMDRAAYQAAVKKTLYSLPNLRFWQDNVTGILTSGGRAAGVRTALGQEFHAPFVLLTTGTFLEGVIHIGLQHMPAGRMGDSASHGLSAGLRSLGLELGRLKTGTTPRLLKGSIDYSRLEEQPGDAATPGFSFCGPKPPLPQVSCYITWTNEKAHEIIRSGFDRSPLFTGVIDGTGARYCPSIEDKVARFPARERHQIFLEPEGLGSGEIYANGISTSLPLDIQQKMVNAIDGLENAVIVRPGYAIEYDYVNPIQTKPTLESKALPGLYMAGQINGTSGYEEAAAQGLWAALNIVQAVRGGKPFLPGRHEAYMGVLVDDLTTLGTEEPYRMFTSRAEHRLLLREDNAEERLTPRGWEIGLVDDEHWGKFCASRDAVRRAEASLDLLKAGPGPNAGKTAKQLLQSPECSLEMAESSIPQLADITSEMHVLCRRKLAADVKYAGYLERQAALAKRSAARGDIALPPDLDYSQIAGLSCEAVEKLVRVRPISLGQAARISGVTPAAVGCIEVYLRKTGLLRR